MPAAQGQQVRLVTSLMYGKTHVLLGATPGAWSLGRKLPCMMPSKCFCVTSCSDPSRCGWTFHVNCGLCATGLRETELC